MQYSNRFKENDFRKNDNGDGSSSTSKPCRSNHSCLSLAAFSSCSYKIKLIRYTISLKKNLRGLSPVFLPFIFPSMMLIVTQLYFYFQHGIHHCSFLLVRFFLIRLMFYPSCSHYYPLRQHLHHSLSLSHVPIVHLSLPYNKILPMYVFLYILFLKL